MYLYIIHLHHIIFKLFEMCDTGYTVSPQHIIPALSIVLNCTLRVALPETCNTWLIGPWPCQINRIDWLIEYIVPAIACPDDIMPPWYFVLSLLPIPCPTILWRRYLVRHPTQLMFQELVWSPSFDLALCVVWARREGQPDTLTGHKEREGETGGTFPHLLYLYKKQSIHPYKYC